MITIFIVDDHKLVRQSIRRVLDKEKHMKIVGEAESGETAVSMLRKIQEPPKVVLMDLLMPGMGGSEATRKLLRYLPEAKVIGLTGLEDMGFATNFLKLGAAGYLLKRSAPEEMIRAIQTVIVGQRYISKQIANVLALDSISQINRSPFDALNTREMHIAMQVVDGKKTLEIADSLNISVKTINGYRYRIFKKLGVRNNVELAHLAIRNGLIDDKVK